MIVKKGWRILKSKIKVLVADDMEIIVRNMKSVIQKNPKVERVDSAFNGEDEINAILNLRPDIVFTDMQMPKKTGLEVISEVKINTSVEKKPEFILVTADRDSSYFTKASELGFSLEYKPISAERINEYINNFGIEPQKEFIEFKVKKRGFFSRIFKR